MITLTNNLKEADFVTHAGNFHADDVFSTALMERIFGNIKLIRLKDYKDDKTKIAYDIGLGEFDHHGALYDKKRNNGIHYCSFGLLWQKYGKKYLEQIKVENQEEVFSIIDELLVIQIDAFDNGEYTIDSPFNIYSLASLIEQFRPKNKNEEENTCFIKAVNFANEIFDRILNDAIIKSKAIETIKIESRKIKDKILILDEFIPYEYALFKLNLDVEFVIYPSNRGGYAAHTVSTKYKGFEPKISFKKEWAGLRDEELQKVSGIKTAKFCHTKLFLATAKTLEDAQLFIKKTKE